MSDVNNAAPPLTNSPEARTETGELKDQTQLQNTNQPNEPEKKAEGDNKPEPKLGPDGKPIEEKKPEGAPEKYADFTVPEGLKLSPELLTKAQETFKGMNLSQEQAQQMIDLHSGEIKRIAEAPINAYNEMREGWKKEVFADATLAANNELRPEVKANIAKAIDSMGAESAAKVREALNNTGVGDHPAIVRMFNHFAQFVTEGRPVQGRGPAPTGQKAPNAGPKSAAQAMFPNLPSANSAS